MTWYLLLFQIYHSTFFAKSFFVLFCNGVLLYTYWRFEEYKYVYLWTNVSSSLCIWYFSRRFSIFSVHLCKSLQQVLLSCDFQKHTKWRYFNISDRNAHLKHISDRLTLDLCESFLWVHSFVDSLKWLLFIWKRANKQF